MKGKYIVLFFLVIFGFGGAGFFFIQNSVSSEGKWQTNCVENEKTKQKICEISQTLVDLESKKRISKLALGKIKKDFIKGVIVTPLGVYISKGVDFKIDGEVIGNMPIEYCLLDGCYALIDTKKTDFVQKAKKGKKAEINITSIEGKTIKLEFSFDGFSKAYKDLEGS